MGGNRPGFDPWVGKIPWKREWLPIPVFWPGEFHGLYSSWGSKESDILILFIYFWPCCVFVAFCKFSLVEASGTTPCCGAWASRPLLTSPVAQMLMSLPVMQDTPVLSLGQEDPWRRKWQPTPVFLPGESTGEEAWQWMEESGRLQSRGRKESDMTE